MVGLSYAGPDTLANRGLVNRQINTDPLFQWRRNYAKRFVSNRHVGVIGDSIVWGQGLTVGTTPNIINYQMNMCQQLQMILNGQIPFGFPDWVNLAVGNTNIYEPTEMGGYSLRPVFAQNSLVPDPFRTVSGTVTYLDRGPGSKTLQLNAGAKIAYTAPAATGFYWWFEDGASNLGTLGVNIYAGDYSSSPTAYRLNGYVQSMNPGFPQYTQNFNTALARVRGRWTIEFYVSTGTPVLNMVYVVDGDNGQGVKCYNLAYGARLSGDFAGNTTMGNTGASGAAKMSGYDAPGLDVVVCYLGANDYANNINPATFQANLEAIVDKYRAAQSRVCAFLMVSHFARYDVTTPTYTWAQYKAAMRAVTKSRAQVDYLDLEPLFPSSQANDTDDDLVDSSGVHLTNTGHSVAAQAIAQRLMYPSI